SGRGNPTLRSSTLAGPSRRSSGSWPIPAASRRGRAARRRLGALLPRGRSFVPHAARHHDPAGRRQQLLLPVILGRPHALLQRSILHGDAEDAAIGALLLLCAAIDEVVVVLVCQRPERPGRVRAMDALAVLHVAPLLIGQRTVGAEVDAPGPAMVVVDR